jgi:bacillithiol system protein YtxJ
MVNWNKLTDENQLESIKKESFHQPILVFKHSTTCGISSATLGRLERKWNDAEAGNLKPYYLDLLRFRSISSKIAQEFGVQHESPQVLIIENGKAVYDASHYDIDFSSIKSLAVSQ